MRLVHVPCVKGILVLHQLRVNRCPLLRDTLRRWGRAGETGLCEACNEPEDTEHYIVNCIKYITHRLIHLGPVPDMKILQESPGDVVRYIRSTGLLRTC